MTTTHDHDTTRHDEPSRGELPPFVFVPDHVGTGPAPAPVEVAQPPAVDDSGRVRRWSTGHSVAAAVVVVGVLASGGAALAARDGGTGGSTVPGQGRFPGGGQLPGGGPQGTFPGQQGQLPGGQLPGGQLPGGPLPGGQLPGSTSGSTGTTTSGSVST